MDRYTYETKFWLDLRFDPRIHAAHGLPWEPFQPVNGIERFGPETFLMTCRWVRLLHHLRGLGAASFLDLGGAEGLTAHLVKSIGGLEVTSCDLSLQACLRARELFGFPAAALDAARLPFPDDAFDVVFMSEVIEHLANPVRTLLELRRVARLAVIVTTEAFARDEQERTAELEERRLHAHMDRSITTPDDLPLVFPGWEALITNQCARIPDPMPAERDRVQADVAALVATHDLEWPAEGLFTLIARGQATAPPHEPATELAGAVFARLAPRERPRRDLPADLPVPEVLLERLRCPACGARLETEPPELACTACGARHPVTAGVPLLHTPPGAAFPESLEARLAREFPEDDARVARLLELDARLAFELPAAWTEDDLLAAGVDRFQAGPGTTVAAAPDGGLVLRGSGADPHVITPRLVRPLADVAGLRVRLASLEGGGGQQVFQVFYRTLERPAFWEPGSVTAGWPADGRPHELRLPLPTGAGFPPDDELLDLRLDPSQGPLDVRLLEVSLLPASPPGQPVSP